MKAGLIRTVRKSFGFTQPEFSSLFGVHRMTVYKWERGTIIPSAFQNDLLRMFHAARSSDDVRTKLASILRERGRMTTLLVVLAAAQR